MSSQLLSLLSVAAAIAAAAALAWLLARSASLRPAVTDSATEGRWELEIAAAREAAARSLGEARTHEQQALQHADQLQRMSEHLRSLEEQVATYLRQYALVKDTLKKEIVQKSSLKAELAASHAQVQALLGRVQELEMERTMAGSGPRRSLRV